MVYIYLLRVILILASQDHVSTPFVPPLVEEAAVIGAASLASNPAAEDITLVRRTLLCSTLQLTPVKPPADLIIIGSAAVDVTAQANTDTDFALAKHSTAPGRISLSLGGVARNMAEAAHRILTAQELPTSSLLVAPIGEDGFGKLLLDEMDKLGMRTDGLLKSDKGTAVCDMVLDSVGNLVGGVADMEITQALLDDQVCFSGPTYGLINRLTHIK